MARFFRFADAVVLFLNGIRCEGGAIEKATWGYLVTGNGFNVAFLKKPRKARKATIYKGGVANTTTYRLSLYKHLV
jgi:hypothetical protein